MTNQRKILIGFSLALTVVLTIGCSFGLALVPALRPYSQWVSLSIAAFGVVVLLAGHSLPVMANTEAWGGSASVQNYREEHPLYFFKKLHYWGWMLVLSAVPIYFLSQHLCKPIAVEARTLPTAKVATEVAAPESRPAPAPAVETKFPQLTVGGLICNGDRSTAVVNGLTVGIGEKVEGVRVVAIERWGITVEMDGRERNIVFSAN